MTTMNWMNPSRANSIRSSFVPRPIARHTCAAPQAVSPSRSIPLGRRARGPDGVRWVRIGHQPSERSPERASREHQPGGRQALPFVSQSLRNFDTNSLSRSSVFTCARQGICGLARASFMRASGISEISEATRVLPVLWMLCTRVSDSPQVGLLLLEPSLRPG